MDEPKFYKVEWKTHYCIPAKDRKIIYETLEGEYYIDHITEDIECVSERIIRWAYV